MTATLTPTPVERLFLRLELGPVRTFERLSGGRLNSVARVNGEWVLRCREAAQATGSLQREARILERLQGKIAAPEVRAQGLDEVLGEYLVQRWVPGETLLRAWLVNPDVGAREWWIKQYTASLRAIHEERFPKPGELPNGELKSSPSWRAYVEGRIRKRLDLLMRVPAMNRELVLTAERYLRRQAPVLDDGPFCLIHRDMHFGNILVEGPRLTAVLDFELAEVGPPDYELDTIFRFLRFPWLYGDCGGPNDATTSRFASVWARLKRGYPELFAVRHLRERLALYALDYELSTLLQLLSGRGHARRAEEATEVAADAAVRRIADIFEGRYGPD